MGKLELCSSKEIFIMCLYAIYYDLQWAWEIFFMVLDSAAISSLMILIVGQRIKKDKNILSQCRTKTFLHKLRK